MKRDLMQLKKIIDNLWLLQKYTRGYRGRRLRETLLLRDLAFSSSSNLTLTSIHLKVDWDESVLAPG